LPAFTQRRDGGIRAISRGKPIFFEHIHSYAENTHLNAILLAFLAMDGNGLDYEKPIRSQN
jgi:hypothetical protein